MKREFNKDPFIFRNAVSDAGYEWTKGKDGKSYLVMLEVPGVALRVKELHPGLFREFAQLETTPKAIQDFAREYGDLFNRWRLPNRGTALGAWREAIDEMRILVGLWDRIKNRDLAELKKIITFTEDGPWYAIVTPNHDVSASLAYETTPSPNQFAPGDVLLPARCALQLEINKRLSEHSTVPLLTWTPDTQETTGGYHQRLIFKPSNLLAAMWVQFAQAVTGKFQLRQCRCGEYFQVGPGARRADATTCGDVCRAERGNDKKKKALEEQRMRRTGAKKHKSGRNST